LPDGRVVTIGNERFRCTEYLFKPEMNGKELPGIDELICNTIKECNCSVIRADLYKNIIISGGNSMFEGFGERL
jgi:actin-related protein